MILYDILYTSSIDEDDNGGRIEGAHIVSGTVNKDTNNILLQYTQGLKISFVECHQFRAIPHDQEEWPLPMRDNSKGKFSRHRKPNPSDTPITRPAPTANTKPLHHTHKAFAPPRPSMSSTDSLIRQVTHYSLDPLSEVNIETKAAAHSDKMSMPKSKK